MTLFSVNEYKPVIAGQITTGNKLGEIGYAKSSLPGAPGYLSAEYFTFNSQGNLYIYDKLDTKIKIYNPNFIFIDEINVIDFMIYDVSCMKIDNNGNIYVIDGIAFKKIGKDKELIYQIDFRALPQSVYSSGNFFLYENFVFFYDDNKNIKSIDEKGNIINEIDTAKTLDTINKSQITRSDTNNSFMNNIEEFKKKDKKNKNLLVLNQKVLAAGDYFLVHDYFKFMREKNTTRAALKTESDEFEKTNYMYRGVDDDSNFYFENENGFNIFNKEGRLLDSFKRFQKGINLSAIAPNGDVYFWEVKPEAVYFYKIARRW